MIDFLLAWYLLRSFRQAYGANCKDRSSLAFPQEYSPQRTVFIPPPLRWDELDDPAAALQNFLSRLGDLVPELQGAAQLGLWAGQVTNQQVLDLLRLYDDWSVAHTPTGDTCIELLEQILLTVPAEDREQRFLTPRQIAGLLADMIRPETGTVYDPCCGTGGLLAALADRMTGRHPFRLYGHEYSEQMWRISKLLCYWRGFPADLGGGPAYALACRPEDLPRADFVIGNPPYNDMRWRRGSRPDEQDPRWRYGIPSKSGAALAWLQHMLYTLKDGGTMAVIMGAASLSKVNERGIRQRIVEDGLLEAVLLLPAGVFYGSQAPSSVWIFRRAGDRENGMLLVDARELGSQRDRQVTLEEPACRRILEAWQAFQQGGYPEEAGFCVCISQEQAAETNWDLDPKRYIHYPPAPLPDWPELARRDEALTRELAELLQENAELLRGILPGEEA